jgi:hypothetical protein
MPQHISKGEISHATAVARRLSALVLHLSAKKSTIERILP